MHPAQPMHWLSVPSSRSDTIYVINLYINLWLVKCNSIPPTTNLSKDTYSLPLFLESCSKFIHICMTRNTSKYINNFFFKMAKACSFLYARYNLYSAINRTSSLLGWISTYSLNVAWSMHKYQWNIVDELGLFATPMYHSLREMWRLTLHTKQINPPSRKGYTTLILIC